MKKFGVIIDGYSSGKFYPDFFKSYEIACLHIQSKPDIPDFVKGCFCSSGYEDIFINEVVEKTYQWIKTHGIPQFIIPGCELGVNLADELCDIFNIPLKNPLSTSEKRRDKFKMQEQIRLSGLRSIVQKKFDNSEDALKWIEDKFIKYPLVVKPLNSTSGDGFHLCNNPDDIRSAFDTELQRENLLNIKNIELLVQEYIEGTEYVVDTISLHGKITITDIMRYQKRIGKYGNTVYERCTFLDLDDSQLKDVVEYTKAVLRELQIDNGPAHTELIIDSRGPVLIETGARLAGCMLDLDFIRNVYGHNQLELSGLLYADLPAYQQAVKNINKQVKLPSSLILFSHNKKGKIKSIDFSEIENSNVYVRTDLNVSIGDQIDEPKNLSEIHAILYLQGEDRNKIDILADKLIGFPDQFMTINTVDASILQD